MAGRRILLLAILVLSLSSPAIAQAGEADVRSKANSLSKSSAAANSTAIDELLKLRADFVSVPVSVVDEDGRLISALTENNFELYTDGIKRKIELFALEQTALALGIVYDLSGSVAKKRAEELTILQKFLEQSNERDEFFAVGVRSKPTLLTDFTHDAAALVNSIALLKPDGGTALFDGIYLAIEKLKQSRAPRRALLIISDGQDNQSRYRYRELRRLIEEADTQVYAIGLSSIWGYRDPLEQQGRTVLRDVTQLSGGLVHFNRDEGELEEAFARINASLRSQYSLIFALPAEARDGRWHKVKVRLVNVERAKAEKLSIRARAGYFAAK